MPRKTGVVQDLIMVCTGLRRPRTLTIWTQTMAKFKCTHCGKDDFRSKKGLSQHLLTKLPCRDKEKARLTSRKSEESQLSYDMAQAQQQQGINSDNESIMEPNPNRLEHDSAQGVGTIAARLRSRKKREESPMDEDNNDFPTGGGSDNRGDEANNSSGEDSLGSLGSKHPNFAEDMDSDDDEGAKSQDSGVTPTKTTDPSGMVRSFHEYCDPSSQPLELPQPEHTGVRLMDILRKNEAPIRAYKDLYVWNLKEKGKIKPYMTAKDAGDQYVSRPTLLKRLAGRYGVSHMAPYEETVRLPHSKEVVKGLGPGDEGGQQSCLSQGWICLHFSPHCHV